MKKADIVLVGKTLFTGLKDAPFEGAVAISGNRILKIIQGTDIQSVTDGNTEIYDCGDRLVMPGFVDGHTHFFNGGIAASPHMCLDIEKSRSEQECVEMMQKYASKNPHKERILGQGWFPANWKNAPLPSKKSLDEAFPDKPVYLLCADVHTAWLNSKALEECGIDRKTAVSYGEIVKDENGDPSGILIEMEAVGIAFRKMLNFSRAALREIYKDFLALLARNGITGVSEMTAFGLNANTLELFGVMQELEDAGDMTARLYLYSSLGTTGEYTRELEIGKRFRSEKLKYCGLKQFVDGVTSTYTAYLLAPYSDRPETSGYTNYPKELFQKCVTAANSVGFGVRLHCIGDGAVRWGLDFFEESNRTNGNEGNKRRLPNAVEHIESIHPDDIPRFKELGVIASLQPYHLTLDANEKISRIGKERSRYEWPHRSFLDAGAALAIGTDYPVVAFNPFNNIYAAITRRDDKGLPTGINPEETLTLAETLKAYTLGSARVYGMENELGTLEEGKLADVIVLDRNLFEIPASEIPECKIDLTVFDGKIIFDRASAS